MAKTISREVTVYVYKFAYVDSASMSITDIEEVNSTEKLGVRRLGEMGKNLGGKICVHADEKTVKYELPLSRFITACEDYSKEVNEEATENNE